MARSVGLEIGAKCRFTIGAKCRFRSARSVVFFIGAKCRIQLARSVGFDWREV